MRPPKKRSGPTEEEIARFAILPEWEAISARSLQKGDRLLWIHTKRAHYTSIPSDDEKMIRHVTVTGMTDDLILTDFGKYRIESGKNQYEACGCKRFCDCYGRLYLPLAQT